MLTLGFKMAASYVATTFRVHDIMFNTCTHTLNLMTLSQLILSDWFRKLDFLVS